MSISSSHGLLSLRLFSVCFSSTRNCWETDVNKFVFVLVAVNLSVLGLFLVVAWGILEHERTDKTVTGDDIQKWNHLPASKDTKKWTSWKYRRESLRSSSGHIYRKRKDFKLNHRQWNIVHTFPSLVRLWLDAVLALRGDRLLDWRLCLQRRSALPCWLQLAWVGQGMSNQSMDSLLPSYIRGALLTLRWWSALPKYAITVFFTLTSPF